jgi:3'(2'), 5'-bisphosphate nucleotidase
LKTEEKICIEVQEVDAMVPIEFQDLIPNLDHTAAVLSSYFSLSDAHLNIELKEDSSPVTHADKEVATYLGNELRARFPTCPLISEEEAIPSFAEREGWDSFFLLDPLDGTKEFLKRSHDFTVNIAFVQANKPVWGVIDAPLLQLRIAGWVGRGAWRFDFLNRAWTPMEPMVVPAGQQLSAALSVSHRSADEATMLEGFDFSKVVRRGSSLKFLLAAMGEVDVYFRRTPTWEWDTAAGQAILESLGGVVCDFSGTPFTYNRESLLNGPFVACHKSLLNTCLQAVKKYESLVRKN